MYSNTTITIDVDFSHCSLFPKTSLECDIQDREPLAEVKRPAGGEW
jgi:hypothetical protein